MTAADRTGIVKDMDPTLRTYHGWMCEGRGVKRGQRARFYLVSPDGKERLPLFAADQTEPLRDTSDWEVVKAADLPEPVKKRGVKQPKRIRFVYKNGRASVWVGDKKDLQALMSSNGFKFHPRDMRYHRDMSAAEVKKMVKVIEDKGYLVIHEHPADTF